MQSRVNSSLSVAGRQRYEEVARRGTMYSKEELRAKISGAISVAERQFYEGLYDEFYGD